MTNISYTWSFRKYYIAHLLTTSPYHIYKACKIRVLFWLPGVDTKMINWGLFTWRWGTPGRWGNPLRWGNPPVHIISHFNSITFTWGNLPHVTSPTWGPLPSCKQAPSVIMFISLLFLFYFRLSYEVFMNRHPATPPPSPPSLSLGKSSHLTWKFLCFVTKVEMGVGIRVDSCVWPIC